MSGHVGDTVTLALRSGATKKTVHVVRGPVRGQMSRVGNLPALNAVLDASEHTVTGPNGSKHIGVIGFSVWLPVLSADIVAALDRFKNADGLVIDLRGNPGGFAIMISLVAGHLLDSTYALGSMRQRTVTLHISANPQVNPYRGPVAVLVDPLSGSTSEFFAGGLQALGRVRVVGDTSAGEAQPAILDRLPNGDVMMHVLADLVDGKGRRVEGVGVIPDDVVPLTLAGLAAGRDDALAAALKWVAAQPRVQPRIH
jgi:carboxyl-terminal processing protease